MTDREHRRRPAPRPTPQIPGQLSVEEIIATVEEQERLEAVCSETRKLERALSELTPALIALRAAAEARLKAMAR